MGNQGLELWEGWKKKKPEKEREKSILLRRIANQNFIGATTAYAVETRHLGAHCPEWTYTLPSHCLGSRSSPPRRWTLYSNFLFLSCK